MKEANKAGESAAGDWLGTAPGITDDMCGSCLVADVIVVGAGVAGLSAARAAAEEGASVIVIEQSGSFNVRGHTFGALGSQFQKSLGADIYDKNEVVNQICLSMGNRVNMALWKKWADESGAAVDWLESILNDEDKRILQFWPNPENYDNNTELRKQYCTGIEYSNWLAVFTKVYNKTLAMDVKYLFLTSALELCKENGAVTGVFAKADYKYLKLEAKKGVILATGDYGCNVEMVKALCPEFYRNCKNGGTSIKTSTGYGHRMAIWAGGMMEPGPHAHMDHSFANMPGIGNTAALNLNLKGKRYMNEDCDGQSFTNQVTRQPGMVGIQVFDSKWREMIPYQAISHGMPNPQRYDYEKKQARLDSAKEKPTASLAGFDTLEELFEWFCLPLDVALASVRRYNGLCREGKDEDFCKRKDRMFPVESPPFYGSRSMIGTGVMTAGVVVDSDLKVLDENYDPIPGLWAAGNAAGGRYACDYPVYPVVGTSHGTAVTFGRSCGMQAAKFQ